MTSKFKVIKFFLILFEKIKYRAHILFRGNYKVIKMYCLPYQQCSLNTLSYTVFEMYQKMFTNFMKHTLSNTKIVISKNVIVTPLLNIITNNTNCTIQCRRTIINIKNILILFGQFIKQWATETISPNYLLINFYIIN